MLTQSEIVAELLRGGLIDAGAIVAGQVEVRDVSRRNQNFAVLTDGDCYLVKQGVGEDGRATVRHEAGVYRLLQASLPPRVLARSVPRFHGYDPAHQMLVMEWVRDAEALSQYHQRTGRFSATLSTALGRLLAGLHELTTSAADRAEATSADRAEATSAVPIAPAWALSVHRPPIELVHNASQGEIEVLKVVQGFDQFGVLLDALRQEWQWSTLIHRDLKWDNCIIAPRARSGGEPELRIVDWEMASMGDPWWDVGSVFNDYLSCWLMSIPMTGETAPERLVPLARCPLPRMQPAIRAFWHAYVRGRRLSDPPARAQLSLAVRYGAARLVQTAYEQSQAMIQLTGNVVCTLQVALNMLRRPEEAAERLLGIPMTEAA